MWYILFIKENIIFFRIHAYDCSRIDKGSLFEIPITVVLPHFLKPEERTFEPAEIEFQASTIQRDFIMVPNKATWAGIYIYIIQK